MYSKPVAPLPPGMAPKGTVHFLLAFDQLPESRDAATLLSAASDIWVALEADHLAALTSRYSAAPTCTFSAAFPMDSAQYFEAAVNSMTWVVAREEHTPDIEIFGIDRSTAAHVVDKLSEERAKQAAAVETSLMTSALLRWDKQVMTEAQLRVVDSLTPNWHLPRTRIRLALVETCTREWFTAETVNLCHKLDAQGLLHPRVRSHLDELVPGWDSRFGAD